MGRLADSARKSRNARVTLTAKPPRQPQAAPQFHSALVKQKELRI